MKRIACLALAAVFALSTALASFSAVQAGGGPPPPPPPPTPTTVEVHIPSLTGHSIDDTEWHFVENQYDNSSAAIGDTITIKWSDGTTSTAPKVKVSGPVIHYSTTDHLTDGIYPVDAWATAYEGWTGQFNLSHGPAAGCTGEDCKPCEGDSCEPPCVGDECNPPPCVGDACNPPPPCIENCEPPIVVDPCAPGNGSGAATNPICKKQDWGKTFCGQMIQIMQSSSNRSGEALAKVKKHNCYEPKWMEPENNWKRRLNNP